MKGLVSFSDEGDTGFYKIQNDQPLALFMVDRACYTIAEMSWILSVLIVARQLFCLNGQDLPWKELLMIEIGASTANFYPELTENALEALLACGFRTLEVFINTESELNSEFIRDLRRKAVAAGARIVSLHPYSAGNEPFLLYSAYRRRFEDGKTLYNRFFEAAAELGASIVVMHGDRLDSPLSVEESLSRYEELYDCGMQYGVRLAQENVVRFRSSDNAYLRAMRDRLDSKAHFVLDLKQAFRCGHALKDVMDAMEGHIVHVHVSDHNAQQDCMPPGLGNTDFKRISSHLEEQHFQGAWIVELYRNNFQCAQDLTECRYFLEKQLEK